MPAVIVLDCNLAGCPADQHPITFSGEREACRKETDHDGQYSLWAKADYYDSTKPEATSLRNGAGNSDAGFIYTLKRRA